MTLSYQKYFIERRVSLLLKILQIFIVVAFTMGIIRFIEKDYIQCIIDFSTIPFLGIGYWVLVADSNRYFMVARIIFLLTVFVSVFVLVHQVDNPLRFVWLSTTIYLVFYLFRKEEALFWLGLTAFVLTVFYVFDPAVFHVGLVHFLVWLLNMVVILMISHGYAISEEASTLKLFELKEHLAAEVREKTKALEEKTHELQSLNQNLEARIQVKIEENQEKDKMLFRQARYAQMGEMISMIAHQWRQPLNTISVTSATMQLLIETGRYDTELFQEKIKTIVGSTEHLSGTIDDFRNFFKQDKEKKEMHFSEIVQNALGLIREGMEKKSIEINTEFLCGCMIYSYPNEIIHVVLNLLKNAEDALRTHNPDSPRITIRIFKSGQYPCLEIEDNAGGIPADMIEKIFDPYFTTKEKSDGTGLGLYMSKIIIEDHCHGKIEVENGAEGACFRILLPPYDKGVSCS